MTIITSIKDIVRSLLAYIHFYLFSVFPHLISFLLYAILPRSLHTRALFLISSLHQLFNLVFARLLPTLPSPTTSLAGQTAIITGANSGIGFSLALALARLDCAVLLTVRSASKGHTAVDSILTRVPTAKGRVKFSILDTSSPTSIRTFAATFPSDQKIDILIHNAGISVPAEPFTPEGLETVYATNFLGSFLLTHLLEPYLSPSARVIFTSSSGQLNASFPSHPPFSTSPVRFTLEPGYHVPTLTILFLNWSIFNPSSSNKYAQSKGMQCAFARLLQKRFDRQHHAPDHHHTSKNSHHHKHADAPSSSSASATSTLISPPRRTAHAFTPSFTSTPIFGKITSPTPNSHPNSLTMTAKDRPTTVDTTVSTVKSSLALLLSDPIFFFLTITTFLATPVSQGSMTGLWLASASTEEITAADKFGAQTGGGGYWDRMNREVSVADVMSDETLQRLWTRWEADAGIEWK